MIFTLMHFPKPYTRDSKIKSKEIGLCLNSEWTVLATDAEQNNHSGERISKVNILWVIVILLN